MGKSNASTAKNTPRRSKNTAGKLRIGDDWNAIRIIALSQSNPLKAIAEFIENSIDAQARNITITRFRQSGAAYLKIVDDGNGVPLDGENKPDFQYVATHICDSVKRQLKARGDQGIQGEFGIGLLSFWTVGESLSMVCAGRDGKSHEMRMRRGNPGYELTSRRTLLANTGTQLTVGPLLPGIRSMSGDKLQWYLASELRDRIRTAKVHIRICDRMARTEYNVEPREFDGRLLHPLPIPNTEFGEVYVELYLSEPQPVRTPSLYRGGTRVIERITELDFFNRPPWTSGQFAGVIDAPFLNLTPGTRTGVIHDQHLDRLFESLTPLETALLEIVEQQQRVALEKSNRDTLKTIQKAFKEALLILPQEEYDWFEVYGLDHQGAAHRRKRPQQATDPEDSVVFDGTAAPRIAGDDLLNEPLASQSDKPSKAPSTAEEPQQKRFFEHAGPLFSCRISPMTATMAVGSSRNFQATPRDRNRRMVDERLSYSWAVIDGSVELNAVNGAAVNVTAPAEPQLVRLKLTVTQAVSLNRRHTQNEDIVVEAEAVITVTDSLLPIHPKTNTQQGLPNYTFEKRPGQIWRSRYEPDGNLIVINNGHRDFAYAASSKALKLRYICRLFGKELILHNFPGYTPDQLLERLIELTLYTEENLR